MTRMQVVHSVVLVVICFLKATYCGDHPDGVSQVSRSQDALGNYHFSYTVNNGEGEQFRQEGSDESGRVVGSYGLKHVDGTHRVVDYVADKNGFRAEVRSNEPGVASAESADASIVRSDHDPPLTVAATSNGDSRQAFGKRLKMGASRVAYVTPPSETEDALDENARETRQRNFDDYRPLSPVAYYPGDVRSPLGPSSQRTNDQPRSPRVLSQIPESDAQPLDVYFPPIDPHSAVRGPSAYLPRRQQFGGNFNSATTSRRPFIPPYGGFDDDPLPADRRPGVSMSTIHGGLDSRRDLSRPAPTPSYGFGRYPSGGPPDNRDFSLPRLSPLGPGFQGLVPQPPGRAPPSVSHNLPPGVLFNPPSYEGRIGTPNFVLRAVPIPNGIQAVRVDPTSGQVYERLVYPLYLRHDGFPAYDRNILLHNDDVGDDDATRNGNSGYYDVPYPSRIYREPRDQPFDVDTSDRDRTGRHNDSRHAFDEHSLSEPTANDLALIHKQLSLVEGFDGDRFANNLLQGGAQIGDSEFDRFQEDRLRYGSPSRLRSEYGQSGLGAYSDGDAFSRTPRHSDQLVSEDSKQMPSNFKEGASSSGKRTETEGGSPQLEKEGNSA